MGVGEDHFELVAHRHTGEHVAHCASNGSKHCVSLLLLQPHPELKSAGLALVTGLLSDLDGDVLEALGESTKLALHHDLTSLHLDAHALGDLELLLGDDVLHGW